MPANSSQRLQILPIRQIDLEDYVFSVSPPWMGIDSLIQSIEKHGILTPLQVQTKKGEQFRVIRGFRRMLAASRLGFSEIPCIIRAGVEPLVLVTEALVENLSTRALSQIEKAYVVQVLKERFQLEDHVVMDQFLPILGIRADRFHLNYYLNLAGLPVALQEGVLNGMEPEVALKLAHWNREEQEFFRALWSRFRLGRNHQRKLVALLDELRASGSGEADSAMDAWEMSGASEISQNENLAPNEAFRECLDQLVRFRFPRIAEHQQQFEQLKANLRLPPRLRLEAPRNFEGDQLKFSFSFASTEELSDVLRKLDELSKEDAIRQILELL